MKNTKVDFQYHPMTVAVRIRPLNQTEIAEGVQCITYKVGQQMVLLKDPAEDPDGVLQGKRSRERAFVFDVVFDQSATQEHLYESTTKNLIEGVISGYNATVFAYGPTGTGKTYTMLGMDYEPGIFIRTLNDLFKAVEDTSGSMDFSVSMSYLEIYNEIIRDLLNPSSGVLELREDFKGNVQISGITTFSIHSAEESMLLIKKGNKQRTQEPTAANKTSSRSHAILQITVKQTSKLKDIQREVRIAKLFMIDLAGSERASQTQNRGQRMKEGGHINRSLLALGNCITALSERGGNQSHHINYRDSKLTRLLKEALSGNSRTVMIAHISPARTAFEESRTTLIYANRAKNIKTRVIRNYENATHHITQYSGIIFDLYQEIHQLQGRMKEHEREIREMKEIGLKIKDAPVSSIEEVHHNDNSDRPQEPINLEDQLNNAFQEHMEMRRSLLQLDNANLELHIDIVRHLVTIADWEIEKARSSTRRRSRKDKVAEDIATDTMDEEGEADAIEPYEIEVAREEINMLLVEKKKAAAMKADLEKHWVNTKMKISQLEQLIPEQLSSDQREVFRLLHRLHELQAWNTELQARTVCKDSLLYQKDFVILSYEQYRSFCEKISHLQRTIIEDDKVHSPELLEKLFQSIEDGTISQLEQQRSLLSGRLKDDIVKNGFDPEECVGSRLHLDIEDLENTYSRKSATNHAIFDLSSFTLDSESDYRTSKSTPGLKPSRQHSSLSLTPFHHLRTPIQPVSNERVDDPSKEVKPTQFFSNTLDTDRRHSLSILQLTPDVLEEIAAGTKSISQVAARRRSRVPGTESSFILKRGNVPTSLHVLENDVSVPRVTQSSFTHCPPIRRSVSIDNLPAETLMKAEDTKALMSPSPKRVPIQKSYWGRRPRSFEAASSQLTKAAHGRNLNRKSFSKSPHSAFHSKPKPASEVKTVLNSKTFLRPKVKTIPPATLLRQDSDQQTEVKEGPLQVLKVNRTPPGMIQQINAGPDKRQVLQKRIKVPGEVTTGKTRSAFPGNLNRSLFTIRQNPPKPDNRRK